MKLKPYLTTVLLTEDSRRHKMRSLRLIIRHQLKRATRLAKPPAFDHIGQHNEDRLSSLPADQPPNREHSLALSPASILISSHLSSSSLADDTSADPEHLLSEVDQQLRLDSQSLPHDLKPSYPEDRNFERHIDPGTKEEQVHGEEHEPSSEPASESDSGSQLVRFSRSPSSHSRRISAPQ